MIAKYDGVIIMQIAGYYILSDGSSELIGSICRYLLSNDMCIPSVLF